MLCFFLVKAVPYLVWSVAGNPVLLIFPFEELCLGIVYIVMTNENSSSRILFCALL